MQTLLPIDRSTGFSFAYRVASTVIWNAFLVYKKRSHT